ncbi:3',5'-cyclic adenosine monophosphate phosphodiesterase CpdA [Azorhizobium oxalatiphilum]|uniref:3',5'-cyclic adenosine monophosphate phosphodiesterase CpdA n=1 Tax=Azorhizobium oxalatiphilum TaxID=980631 RepID=A0A917F499_9HYPH|nr:phosphodiesterase [Azorhizobium oxalatiphilum]GGF49012.1 3',5'-cyclic adenosine monophosphate phosphodiesterase CpdA [Azorhizobium oxalatiphilum]
MLIAQLTDTHIRIPGKLAYGVVDSSAYLERAVAWLRALPQRPDAVVVTGDLTDFDQLEEYARFRSIMEPLDLPVHVIPGNHDSSVGVREAFPQIVARTGGKPDGKVNYVVEELPLRIIMLDSSVPKKPHGELGPETLEWLDRQLMKSRRDTVVALHHPPFLTGIRHMDAQNLKDAAAFETVIARHAHVLGVWCGHVHRTIVTNFAGRPCRIAPSTAHAVSFALAKDAPASFHMEPPAVSLHLYEPGRVVSHTCFVSPYDGPYPFFDTSNRLMG